MKKKNVSVLLAGVSLLTLCCCSTKYDTAQRYIYVDQATLEDKSDSEIMLPHAIRMEQLDEEKKLNIGIILSVNSMLDTMKDNAGNPVLPDVVGFTEAALDAARVNLISTKAYKVTVLPPQTSKDQLMTGKDFAGIQYSFFIEMKINLTGEVKRGYDSDTALCKTTIDWILIDNRTKSNGLGELETPVADKANTCRSMNTFGLGIGSISGRSGLTGENQNRAQNHFFNAMRNAMFEFQAQLTNRVPFGGKVRELWQLDEKYFMSLQDADQMGVVPGMQMLVVNKRGNKVAIATATGGAQGINLEIWRWLSKSYQSKICQAAENDADAKKFLKENPFYAVCLGMPKPASDVITNFNDTK